MTTTLHDVYFLVNTEDKEPTKIPEDVSIIKVIECLQREDCTSFDLFFTPLSGDFKKYLPNAMRIKSDWYVNLGYYQKVKLDKFNFEFSKRFNNIWR